MIYVLYHLNMLYWDVANSIFHILYLYKLWICIAYLVSVYEMYSMQFPSLRNAITHPSPSHSR